MEWWTSPEDKTEAENARTIMQRQYPSGDMEYFYVTGYVTKYLASSGEYIFYGQDGEVYAPEQ